MSDGPVAGNDGAPTGAEPATGDEGLSAAERRDAFNSTDGDLPDAPGEGAPPPAPPADPPAPKPKPAAPPPAAPPAPPPAPPADPPATRTPAPPPAAPAPDPGPDPIVYDPKALPPEKLYQTYTDGLADVVIPDPTAADPKATSTLAAYYKDYPGLMHAMAIIARQASAHAAAPFHGMRQAQEAAAAEQGAAQLVTQLEEAGIEGAAELRENADFWKWVDEKPWRGAAMDSNDPEAMAQAIRAWPGYKGKAGAGAPPAETAEQKAARLQREERDREANLHGGTRRSVSRSPRAPAAPQDDPTTEEGRRARFEDTSDDIPD